MEMRVCKECGKLFQPKGREQYCSDVHYRPCPVCGEPVIAKYLSDPARRCDKCKGKKSATSATAGFAFKDFKAAVAKDDKARGVVTPQPTKKKPSDEDKNDEAFTSNPIDRQVDQAILKIIDNSFPVVRTSAEFAIGFEHRWIYVGVPTKNGFQPGHEYSIKLAKDEYGYIVTSDEDITGNLSVDIYDRFSSTISLNRNFVRSTPVGEE